MIVFVAGMPRAGSMWTYNVVRTIFEARGWTVLPKEVPVSEHALIKEALLSEQKDNQVYCIKTHLPLKSPLPTKHDARIICNVRDVRDACLSFMRFMHADHEAAVRAMIGMMRITDYYQTQFGDDLLSVRFEDLIDSPLKVLENISGFLNIDLLESEKKEILQKFDKSNIQKKLREMPKVESDEEVLLNTGQSSKFVPLKNRDGTYRAYEKATGFQSNHITSTSDGEWRAYFDSGKADQLTALSREWLLKHGYEI